MNEKISTEANTKINWMLELPDKDFKVIIIKMIQHGITNELKTNEERDILTKYKIQKKEPNGNDRVEKYKRNLKLREKMGFLGGSVG